MTIDQYAVMGNPIAHSKSPKIHTLFARQTSQVMDYQAMLVPEDEFASALDAFHQQGGKGLNITIPFKQQAWERMDVLSDRARLAGAVNTIILGTDGRRYGDNTDGVGLVRDITQNHQIEIRGKNVLVLGAGGAVRGVLEPLLEQKPEKVVIANRTVSKAEELAGVFTLKDTIEACGFDQLEGQQFDLIINGTAASLQGGVPPIPETVLKPGGGCYDMMYSDKPTAFVEWGNQHGAGKAMDGLGMLVEQAAESFYLWRNVRPETAPVIEALRLDK
jgi:shikimate dehydrogenase